MGTKKDIQSRRDFFKKVGTRTLPFLGTVVLGPAISLTTLTSCGCDGCEAACMDNCEGGCVGSCQGSAVGSTCSDCSSSCSGSSTSNICSSCANDCSSSCKETCNNTCEGSAQGKPTSGTIDGHEYVDLGLSVLWATCDIGATSPEENGKKQPLVYPDYYDTDGGESWYGESWYDKFSSLGLEVGGSISGAYYDTARISWGNKWRTPTLDEISELCYKCKKTKNADGSMLYTSTINGKSIVISPDEHWSADVTKKEKEEKSEYYYGRTLESSLDCFIAYKYYHDRYTSFWNYVVRTYLIRPVIDRNVADVSSCNGSCTANCSSDCTSSCKNKCSGTCKGTCGRDCTGGCSSSCTGGCKSTCTKTCADTCASDCTSGCSTGCSSTCKGTCSGGCSSGCSGGCKGTCSGSCGSGCSGGCSGCTATCKSSCEFGCVASCSNDCSSSCTGGCDSSCRGTCVTTCTGTCYNTCNDTCFGSCRITCEGWTK